MSAGDIGYVTSGGIDLAYRVRGDGPTLLIAPGLLDTIQVEDSYLPITAGVDRLAGFARVVRYDKRGCGLSEQLPRGERLDPEVMAADLLAVLDAADQPSAILLGTADGAWAAIQLAIDHPDRVDGLVITSTTPRVAWAPDWPSGITREDFEVGLDLITAGWGSGVSGSSFGASDPSVIEEFGRLERLTGSPSVIRRLFETWWEVDLRPRLPEIQAPTLIVHHQDHPIWPVEGGRHLAEAIPGARLVELAGAPDTIGPAGATPEVLDLIERFVTGREPARVGDRVLRTILFTDIVRSTEEVERLGDRAWRELLDRHEPEVAEVVARSGGTVVKSTGDGLLAVFEVPSRAIEAADAAMASARRAGISLRAGVHTGECERRGDDYVGFAVHVAARVCGAAAPGEVLVTRVVGDLAAGSGIVFVERGRHDLKGVSGDWDLFAATL